MPQRKINDLSTKVRHFVTTSSALRQWCKSLPPLALNLTSSLRQERNTIGFFRWFPVDSVQILRWGRARIFIIHRQQVQ